MAKKKKARGGNHGREQNDKQIIAQQGDSGQYLSERWGIFAPIPLNVIKLFPSLSGNDVMVYVYLMARVNQKRNDQVAFPGKRTMRKETGLAYDTIDKSIESLESVGALEVQRSDGKLNRYKVLNPEGERLRANIEAQIAAGWGTIDLSSKADRSKFWNGTVPDSGTELDEINVDEKKESLSDSLDSSPKGPQQQPAIRERSYRERLAAALETASGCAAGRSGFDDALRALEEANVEPKLVSLWFTDPSGWEAVCPPDAGRLQPWPSQVAEHVLEWQPPEDWDWRRCPHCGVTKPPRRFVNGVCDTCTDRLVYLEVGNARVVEPNRHG